MNKFKLTIIGIIAVLFVGLGLTVWQQSNRIQQLNDDLLVSVNNNKAYEAERDSLRNNAIQFQFTIDQINHSNDSLVNKINDMRKQVKVKDKQISELQYFASVNSKRDTIYLKEHATDTIFQVGVALDTLIGDDWSQLAIRAEYPNFLDVDYSFKNETLVIMHDSRVTVDPPKKCWLARLFQKKQTIVEIDVVQENPYCVNKEQKFIKVVK